MVEIEVNEQLLRQQSEALAALLVDSPETRKRIRKQIREQMKIVRRNISNDVRQVMEEDPRKAYRAIKSTIYRRILGSNVSILNPRKSGARYQLIKPRKLDQNPHQRGGNRVKRSERTNAIDSYFGKDRAFILRFVNSGTQKRMAGVRGGKISGDRGSIAPRNWFDHVAVWHMDQAADRLGKLIEEELAAAYDEKI